MDQAAPPGPHGSDIPDTYTHEPLPLVIGAYALNSKCSMGGKIRKKQKNSQCTLIIPTNPNLGIIQCCVLLVGYSGNVFQKEKNFESVSNLTRILSGNA